MKENAIWSWEMLKRVEHWLVSATCHGGLQRCHVQKTHPEKTDKKKRLNRIVWKKHDILKHSISAKNALPHFCPWFAVKWGIREVSYRSLPQHGVILDFIQQLYTAMFDDCLEGNSSVHKFE